MSHPKDYLTSCYYLTSDLLDLIFKDLSHYDFQQIALINKYLSNYCRNNRDTLMNKYVAEKSKKAINMFDFFLIQIERGHINVVKSLIQKGLDPSRCDGMALYIAIKYNQLKMVDLLLLDGRINPSYFCRTSPRIEPNHSFSPRSNKPFEFSLKLGRCEIILRLVQDPRTNIREYVEQIFYIACINDKIELALTVINSINLRNYKDYSKVLEHAKCYCYGEIINLLLDNY